MTYDPDWPPEAVEDLLMKTALTPGGLAKRITQVRDHAPDAPTMRPTPSARDVRAWTKDREPFGFLQIDQFLPTLDRIATTMLPWWDGLSPIHRNIGYTQDRKDRQSRTTQQHANH